VAPWFPHIASLVAVRGAHTVLRNSLFRSAYELLYTPLPSESKRVAKPLIDVGCDRLGTIAGNATVLLMLAILEVPMATRGVLLLAGVTAAALVVLGPWLRRGYVAALAASLRKGADSGDARDVMDAATRSTLFEMVARPEAWGAVQPAPAAQDEAETRATDPILEAIAGLRSGDERRIRQVLSADTQGATLVPHVIPLLARDDLFADVVAALRRWGASSVGQLLDVLLEATQPSAVRLRVPRVLKAFPTRRAFDGLFGALAEVPFDVRYRCGQALLRMRNANPDLVAPKAAVFAAVSRELEGAGQGGRLLDHLFSLLALGLDRDPLATCLWALRHGDPTLRGTALEYLDNVLPDSLKGKLWPHVSGGLPPVSSGRATDEIREDLLRSTAAAGRPTSRSSIRATR
jgi:ATP:ADP antiporter, AAA family